MLKKLALSTLYNVSEEAAVYSLRVDGSALPFLFLAWGAADYFSWSVCVQLYVCINSLCCQEFQKSLIDERIDN